MQMKTIKAIILASLQSILLIAGLLSATCWGVFIWLIGTKALPDTLGFGYYRDFNIARKAIEQSVCAESIEYSRHEDLTLESFHFKIRTESGRVVRLWFHEGMDVKEVCSNPPGLLVLHPHNRNSLSQGYSIAELSARLANKGIRVANVNDVLCNIDDLASLFQANYDSEDITRITYKDADYDRFLRIEIVEAGRGNEFVYSRIR
jgi:hypothetical protein